MPGQGKLKKEKKKEKKKQEGSTLVPKEMRMAARRMVRARVADIGVGAIKG